MPPIPVYTTSPINAAKADGVNPKTAAPPVQDSTGPNQRYAPVQPTPTTTTQNPYSNDNSPPPPRPGAVPTLPTQTGPTRTAVPPPPRAGEAYSPHPPQITPAAQLPPSGGGVPYPPQMSISAPAAPYAPRGTATATGPSPSSYSSPPAQLPGGPRGGVYGDDSLSHPPGYQQDVNASYSPVASSGGGQQGGMSQHHFPGSSENQGRSNDDDDGVFSSAMKWAQVAGKKLSAAETEVWRRINK
ncbi:hypothetical protein B0T17DRAFT_508638 [Bombardia bombarda]|uniref:Uncharacterized protein n=1 Tax=Bombardia bombarda TaxID=252184 RepID=A0AA39WTG0_9PEZI|nr:hypothetical protein B0T17DRAFT_508638 [Bombardia bombarda]